MGEAVFSTGMTGYQETLTDPSYHRQVVVMTAPHIGNTGVNDEDDESRRIWVGRLRRARPRPRPSNWRSPAHASRTSSPTRASSGICEIDTRALTRHLRERGAMRVGIFSGERAAAADELLDACVASAPQMAGAALAARGHHRPRPYVVPAVGEQRFTVAALDLGIKAMTPR